MAEIQSVPDSGTNIVTPFLLTEIEAPSEIKSKEPICFYCKAPLSQCENQKHWEKKLATEGLTDNRAMAPRGGKNFILVSGVPADESFEKLEAAEIQKEIGQVTPSGQNPDPEDSNLNSSLDFHWLEQTFWKPVERLEEERIQHYIEKCPDIELALRWHLTFPPYLRDLLLAEWLKKRPSILHAVEQFLAATNAAEYRTEKLTLNCSRCRIPAELTLTLYGNATIVEPPIFTCADCLGRLGDFIPRSRLRKYPSCRRHKVRKAA